MNKEIIYQIIDNKINKFNYNITTFQNIINNKYVFNQIHILISAIKICKRTDLNLKLSNTFFDYNYFNSLLQIFKYLITDTKIIKLNLSDCSIFFQENNIYCKIKKDLKNINKNINNLKKYINNFNTKINDYNLNIEKYDCYKDYSEDFIKDCLTYINQLNKINDININNKISNPIKNIIYNMFKHNKTLQILNISYNNENFNCFIIKQLLKSGNTTIKSLNIMITIKKCRDEDCYYNNKSFKLRSKLLNNNNITSLKLSFLQSLFDYYEDFKIFLESLENNTSLIKFSFYTFNKYIFLILLNSIMKNKHIKVLDLSKVKIINKHSFNYVLFNNLILTNTSIKTIIFKNKIKIRSYYNKEYFIEKQKSFNIDNKYDISDDNEYLIKKDLNNIINNLNYLNLDISEDILYQNNVEFDPKKGDCVKLNEYINYIKNKNLNECENNEYKEYFKLLQDRLKNINFIYK